VEGVRKFSETMALGLRGGEEGRAFRLKMGPVVGGFGRCEVSARQAEAGPD